MENAARLDGFRKKDPWEWETLAKAPLEIFVESAKQMSNKRVCFLSFLGVQ